VLSDVEEALATPHGARGPERRDHAARLAPLGPGRRLTADRLFATIEPVAAAEHDDTTVYRVVLNDEEQYSIWPLTRELPAGWRDEGTTGTKQECLDRIDAVWTDMRPLSLRRAMEADREGS